MASISIRKLCVNYDAVKVLEDLDLDIEAGEFIVLLGPSGCGKSTLLNCIAGLLDISGGQILIKDRNVTWLEPKDRGIGMVFQSYALYPQMTVRGNLSFGIKNAGLSKEEVDQRIDRTSKLLHIEELLERKPAALSGGQRQRVAIGRALVRDVDVFLFDEPLSNLDAKLRAELRVEIKRLHQQLESNTMVYVTHDQIEALTLADRIAVMKNGIIQQLADPHEIYNRPTNLYVASFIGSPSMNFIKGKIEGNAFSFEGGKAKLDSYQAEQEGALAGSGGKEALLGLRPEHVVLGGGGRDPIGRGKVDIIEPMGSDSLVWINIGDASISSRQEGATAFKKGQEVEVGADISLASVFAKDSEKRL